MISSNWKISHMTGTPLVLLNFGDRLLEEIDWGGARLAEAIPLVRSTSPRIRQGGNAAYRLSFSVIKTSSTDVLSRTAILDSLIAWGSTTVEALKVEAYGLATSYWQFGSAVITAYNETSRPVGIGKRITTVDILAATLTKVTPP